MQRIIEQHRDFVPKAEIYFADSAFCLTVILCDKARWQCGNVGRISTLRLRPINPMLNDVALKDDKRTVTSLIISLPCRRSRGPLSSGSVPFASAGSETGKGG